MALWPARRIFKSEPSIPRTQRWRAIAIHVIQKIAMLTAGAIYTSAWASSIRRYLNRNADQRPFPGRVALVAHAYYPELLPEVLDCFANLPSNSQLILTVPATDLAAVTRQLAGLERTTIIAAANRGRDIAPFIALLNSGTLDHYDVVLKLHTKRSPHLLDGNIRRRMLYAMLAGSKKRTAHILTHFLDETTGLVGWRPSWRRGVAYWMSNRSRVAELAERMGCPTPIVPNFFEGSMFWVRTATLKRLRDIDLSLDEFEKEEGQTDGTLHHAIERIFALAAVADGYEVQDHRGRRLLNSSAIASEGRPSHVSTRTSRHGASLQKERR